VTINNQCTNIVLTSPVCFIKDTKCHIQFPQQVNPKSIIKANFLISIERDMFGGALLYHLQRKEDISTDIQLLVIWGYKYNRPYSDTWLIEHKSTLVWNEDMLKRLHDVYNNQSSLHISIKNWLLDNNTMLKIVCETLHGDFKMEVIIFEETHQHLPIEPLWIDSTR
jgi:hypothetical protein